MSRTRAVSCFGREADDRGADPEVQHHQVERDRADERPDPERLGADLVQHDRRDDQAREDRCAVHGVDPERIASKSRISGAGVAQLATRYEDEVAREEPRVQAAQAAADEGELRSREAGQEPTDRGRRVHVQVRRVVFRRPTGEEQDPT